MLGYFLADRPNSVPVELGIADCVNSEGPAADIPAKRRPVSVLLLGDDPIMEADLCEHLWSHPDFDLIAVHYDVRSAMRVANALEPDIILVHIGREETDRLSFIHAVRAHRPQALILVSVSKSGHHLRKQALAAGANGELVDIEDASLCHTVLVETINFFAEHTTDGDAKTAKSHAHYVYFADRSACAPAGSEMIDLTQIEIEIGRYLAAGRSIQEIASYLSLSPKTISMHRSRIRQGLCCRTNAELNTLLAKYLQP